MIYMMSTMKGRMALARAHPVQPMEALLNCLAAAMSPLDALEEA